MNKKFITAYFKDKDKKRKLVEITMPYFASITSIIGSSYSKNYITTELMTLSTIFIPQQEP